MLWHSLASKQPRALGFVPDDVVSKAPMTRLLFGGHSYENGLLEVSIVVDDPTAFAIRTGFGRLSGIESESRPASDRNGVRLHDWKHHPTWSESAVHLRFTQHHNAQLIRRILSAVNSRAVFLMKETRS